LPWNFGLEGVLLFARSCFLEEGMMGRPFFVLKVVGGWGCGGGRLQDLLVWEGGMGNFQVFFKKILGENNHLHQHLTLIHIRRVGGGKQAISQTWHKCVSCLGDDCMAYVNFV